MKKILILIIILSSVVTYSMRNPFTKIVKNHFTFEKITGKWYFNKAVENIHNQFSKNGFFFTFNPDGNFEYSYTRYASNNQVIFSHKVNGKYKVSNNSIFITVLKEKSSEPVNEFPEEWKIISDEQDVQLDILALKVNENPYTNIASSAVYYFHRLTNQ